MRLCPTPTTAVRRTWTVELRPQHEGPVLVCPQCPPGHRAAPGVSARSAVLAHLARHARSDVLPSYLRTCQCHEGGCRWHSRRRGCDGPILLVLTCARNGRIWRLADTCAACAAATAHAAVVPDTPLSASRAELPSDPRNPDRAEPGGPSGRSSEQLFVEGMLSYLTVSLPPQTSAAARLLALQCALRTNDRGRIGLPIGLLRSMRLGRDPSPWQDLEQAHWLHRLPPTGPSTCRAVGMQLLDPTVLSQAPSRSDRIQAADWALRASYTKRLRHLDEAGRLLTLTLATHPSAADSAGRVEHGRLTRICGLTAQELATASDRLDKGVSGRL
jgi:hypothetical protein